MPLPRSIRTTYERKALVSMPNSHLFSHLFMCAVELALKGALFSSPRLGSQRYGVGHKWDLSWSIAATAQVIYGCMCTCVSTDHTTKLAVCASGLRLVQSSRACLTLVNKAFLYLGCFFVRVFAFFFPIAPNKPTAIQSILLSIKQFSS